MEHELPERLFCSRGCYKNETLAFCSMLGPQTFILIKYLTAGNCISMIFRHVNRTDRIQSQSPDHKCQQFLISCDLCPKNKRRLIKTFSALKLVNRHRKLICIFNERPDLLRGQPFFPGSNGKESRTFSASDFAVAH